MKSSFYLKASILSVLLFCCSTAFAQSPQRTDLLKEIDSLRSQLAIRENAFLSPSDEDRASLAEFLHQPDTGLIRLLPREEFDAKNKLTIRGGGAYYSFTRLTHEYGYGSDIQLEMNRLSVAFAGANYGMIARIDAVTLDDLALESRGVQFLAEYQPATAEPEARSEYQRFGYWKGVEVDQTTYTRSVPLEVGATYVLRSIDYGHSDVLVGINVVRKDEDGSAIIAWKMLKKFPKPELKRPGASK